MFDVLLVLQFLPEETKFYSLKVSTREAKLLILVHNKYLGLTPDLTPKVERAILCVLAACSSSKEGFDGVPESWLTRNWHEFELDVASTIQTIPSSRVILTGMAI